MSPSALAIKRYDAVRLRDGSIADVLQVFNEPGERSKVHLEYSGEVHATAIVSTDEIVSIVWSLNPLFEDENEFVGTHAEGLEGRVRQRVSYCFGRESMNCSMTTLTVLSELLGIRLDPQTLQACIGMQGAGGRGDQCGLVEAQLMLIGILGSEKGLPNQSIVKLCKDFAEDFHTHYGSLLCKELRPPGFGVPRPLPFCQEFTQRAILHAWDYFREKSLVENEEFSFMQFFQNVE